MELRRAVSVCFRFMSGFATLFVLFALGLAAWNLHFALTADVRPGVFVDYRTVHFKTRVRDSRGSYRDSSSQEYRPSFRYTAADGSVVTVEEGAAHLFRYHDPGDAIEVLVDPGGAREPLIRGFVSLFGDATAVLLVGALFVAFAEFARAKVLALLGGGAGGRLGGLGARFEALRAGGAQAADAAVAAPAASAPRRGGCGALLLLMVALGAAGAGAFLWLDSGGPAAVPVPEAAPEPSSPVVGAELPPPAVPAEEPATGDVPRTVPAATPTRRGPSAVDDAARAGDAAELARLLDAGGDIAEVRPATVKTLVGKGDLATLRVVFGNGFDLTQHYARQTFGDQAVSKRSTEVVRLVREFGGLFEAPPEFVALAAHDLPALRAALASAPPDRRWRGQTIDSFARHPEAKALLEQARAP